MIIFHKTSYESVTRLPHDRSITVGAMFFEGGGQRASYNQSCCDWRGALFCVAVASATILILLELLILGWLYGRMDKQYRVLASLRLTTCSNRSLLELGAALLSVCACGSVLGTGGSDSSCTETCRGCNCSGNGSDQRTVGMEDLVVAAVHYSG